MGNKISKLTDRLLIRAAFDLSKRYIQYSFLDNLAIILLEEESSMALHILSARLSRETLRDLPHRIKEHITHRPQYEELSPEEF
jgi:ATP-dependent Clp protease ATP-binding subunit ClpA